MEKKLLLSRLEAFDPEIYAFLQKEKQRQRYTLSLVPSVNAMSPFAAYLEGSILTNCVYDRRAAS